MIASPLPASIYMPNPSTNRTTAQTTTRFKISLSVIYFLQKVSAGVRRTLRLRAFSRRVILQIFCCYFITMENNLSILPSLKIRAHRPVCQEQGRPGCRSPLRRPVLRTHRSPPAYALKNRSGRAAAAGPASKRGSGKAASRGRSDTGRAPTPLFSGGACRACAQSRPRSGTRRNSARGRRICSHRAGAGRKTPSG